MLRLVLLISLWVGMIYGLGECDYGGMIHKSGDRFNSTDNCNTCFCTNGAVACTLKACINLPQPKTCSYGDQVYQDGDSFKGLDGCNTCGCQNGMVLCTEMFCLPLTGAPPP